MGIVRRLLQDKEQAIWSIGPDAFVYEALELLAEKNVGALLVRDAGVLVGIISERDYARRVELQGKSSRDTRVKDIMTRRVIYVRPEQRVEECMALMTEKRVRHLPVIEGDQLIGVVSIGDVVKGIIAEKEFIIQQLENYITGG